MLGETDREYRKQEILVEIPKGKDTVKVIIGHKMVSGVLKKYLDVRVWYPNDDNEIKPGRGFAKPLNKEEMARIGQVILDYAATM